MDKEQAPKKMSEKMSRLPKSIHQSTRTCLALFLLHFQVQKSFACRIEYSSLHQGRQKGLC